jgi:hypothetical protein
MGSEGEKEDGKERRRTRMQEAAGGGCEIHHTAMQQPFVHLTPTSILGTIH